MKLIKEFNFKLVKLENLGVVQVGISSQEKILKGEVIRDFSHLIPSETNDPFSFQISEKLYLKDHEFISKVNHSCDPNIIVNTSLKKCIAIRDIESFEVLTYFYPSTEWNPFHSPFKCKCRSLNCIGSIDGASVLSINILKNYFLNQFIQDSLMKLGHGIG